jgi:predicted DNA-binding transcriptional regulator AlpA
MTKRDNPLYGLIGLSREDAAAAVGVSPTLFDEMVEDGRMPKPKRINSRKVWSRRAVEQAFDALGGPDEDDDRDRPTRVFA